METVLGEDKPFTLRTASLFCQEKERSLECVLLHIDSKEEKDNHKDADGEVAITQFSTLLEWLTFSLGKELLLCCL